MAFIKKSTLLYLLSLVLAIFVFLKTAWISEDAYIIFRSIEQLFAGNGPVWNPHERVQVFTSPLWFFLLSTVRIFSHNVYLNAIVVSLILWILTIFTLKKTFESNVVLLTSILLFSASSGFYDYTSSGLENVLAYFVIAAYILNYTKLFAFDEDSKIPKENLIKFVLISFGLIICVRHDLLLILLPPTIYAVFKNWRLFSIKQWIILGIMVLSPFILWSLFSLIYYGFLFPNTAYAKLNTGIPRIEIFIQGLKYFTTELIAYRPDIVIVCYGWNDHWQSSNGLPDKLQKPLKSSIMVKLSDLRIIRWIYATVIRKKQKHYRALGPAHSMRVPIADYEYNIRKFVDTCKKEGIKLILMTAPYLDGEYDFVNGIIKKLYYCNIFNSTKLDSTDSQFIDIYQALIDGEKLEKVLSKFSYRELGIYGW